MKINLRHAVSVLVFDTSSAFFVSKSSILSIYTADTAVYYLTTFQHFQKYRDMLRV